MRTVTKINDNWTFYKDTEGSAPVAVTLPHTWNAVDGQDGGNDYYRGRCRYERELDIAAPKEGERIYVEFRGAALSAEVLLNGEKLAEHKGGFSTWRTDLTDHLKAAGNLLTVYVDNSDDLTVYPQKADFTFYGGIYRSVYLIRVPAVHFDLDGHGSNAIRVTPDINLADHKASITVDTWVSGISVNEPADSYYAAITLKTADHSEIQDGQLNITSVVPLKDGKASTTINLNPAHLWNGLDDPFLYEAEAKLLTAADAERLLAPAVTDQSLSGDIATADVVKLAAAREAEGAESESAGEAQVDVLDSVSTRFGCRTMEIDAQKGFLLNGRTYQLRGVSRHQDRKGSGNAITVEEMREDLSIIEEIGANFIRLAHYQHAQEFYDLCDEKGFVVWAEIPFITRFVPEGRENTLSQMTELIVQNYNHPCIAVWALSNEITAASPVNEALIENHRSLNNLAHRLDPTRKTALANVFMLETDSPLLEVPDVNAYNLYYGWYVGELDQNDEFFDEWHEKYPDRPIGFSEYGADANPQFQAEHPERSDYTEGYQALYHEHILKMITKRPWLWMTSVWNMFDFAADGRDEGGKKGENQKGLVTFDRKVRKDAFYIYKAYWNKKDAFVHICGSRYVNRESAETEVKAYSNLPSVELFVNGKSAGKLTDAGDHTFRWKIALDGEADIVAVGYGVPADAPSKLQAAAWDVTAGGIAAAVGTGETFAAGAETCRDEIRIRKVESVDTSYCMNGEAPVRNWFDEDIDPAFFSVEDKFGELMANPDAGKILQGIMAKMTAKRGDVAQSTSGNANLMKMMGRMKFSSLLKQGGADEQSVKSINRMLQQIKK